MMNYTCAQHLPGDALRPIIERAHNHDGVAAFSEQFEAGLDDARLRHTHLILREDDQGEEIGIAALAPDGSAELVVDPPYRRRGGGTTLVKAVLEQRPDAGLWAHGNLPAAQALADQLRLRVQRELLVMAVEGDDLTRAAVLTVPPGFTALNYVDAVARWGKDEVESDWLVANNDAFSWHPEQGGWDLNRLQRAMEADWFDPAGVWFLYSGETLAGFHWTKRHLDGEGEVYVVGLHSSYRGQGLGGPLTQIGLKHLVDSGSTQVKLYVEADNGPAVHRYRDLGFQTRERHVVYGRTAS